MAPPRRTGTPLREDGRRDFRHLSGLLQQPHDALGERGFERPVWHCSVRAAPGDRMLSDDEWAQIACEIMHRTGLAPYGQEDEAVRWIAVRHAADHIHLVAVLARQDGARPRLWNDYYRIGEACRAAEHRFGLQATAPRDRTAARRPSRAESEKARRRGRDEPPRVTLRRAVATAAAASSSEREFFARLDAAGISVRKRVSTRNPGEITGYAVALPTDTTNAGGPVWYGGGKLAPDLTLPKLRHRWTPAAPPGPPAYSPRPNATPSTSTPPGPPATPRSRSATSPATDPGAAADAAWAAADTLHAAASALGNPELSRAADTYDRAARCAYGRLPRPTPAGTRLRTAARILTAAAIATGDPLIAQLRLILKLAALAEAVIDLRTAQRHAAQAGAARTAAERIYAARRSYTAPPARTAKARVPGDHASRDFPILIDEVLADLSPDMAAPEPAPTNRPSRVPPRQHGPTR